jgi:hypothetical protein
MGDSREGARRSHRVPVAQPTFLFVPTSQVMAVAEREGARMRAA